MNTPSSDDFERALRGLEEVVARLEQGDLPLEEGLAAFEEGMSLSRHCQQRLDAAEKRIEELLANPGEERAAR
ncbi:MAG: exodeoxyribonuclease VII small subunit [Magnetococcales bacterium]|nr:exodeoxyribonuclease VII small subunit [Magnetococcales bacterium]NGZ06714.1 exodeoxyribonuclease VII small subunit [Magnetococcales bacterium]